MTHEQPSNIPNFQELGNPHIVARTEINAKLITMAKVELDIASVERAAVPDEVIDWSIDYPGYQPPFIDLPRGNTRFRKQGDRPDVRDPSRIQSFTSLETTIVRRDERGFPYNPLGRTGLAGRGMLDKWGATPAADPILTRFHPIKRSLETLLIKRGDTGEWALPGGKVDPFEEAWQAANRELIEEAGIGGMELNFAKARVVFAGYADDSRNTDNAWMETTVLHVHLNNSQARSITIEAGSDADAAQWVSVDDDLFDNLFSAHGEYLRLAFK